MYEEIKNQMILHNEKQKDIAKLLGLDISQICRKLKGEVAWTIGDIEILCKRYNMDFWKLFKRKED